MIHTDWSLEHYEEQGILEETLVHEASHISVVIYMRGLLTQLYTRIYFSDELESNSTDRVLTKIPPQRRKTLIAQRRESMGETTYEFNICMQGSQETVFFHL